MERLRHVVANLDQAVHVLTSVINTTDAGKVQAASDRPVPTAVLQPRCSSQGRRSRREPGPEPESSESAPGDVARSLTEKSHDVYDPREDCMKGVEENTDAWKRPLTEQNHDVHDPQKDCKKVVEKTTEAPLASETHKALKARAARRALLEQRRRTSDARQEPTVRRTTLYDALEEDDAIEASMSDDSAWKSVAAYFGVGGHRQPLQSGVRVTHKEGRGCMIYCW